MRPGRQPVSGAQAGPQEPRAGASRRLRGHQATKRDEPAEGSLSRGRPVPAVVLWGPHGRQRAAGSRGPLPPSHNRVSGRGLGMSGLVWSGPVWSGLVNPGLVRSG